MSEVLAVAAATGAPLAATSVLPAAPLSPADTPSIGFGDLLTQAFQHVENKVNVANEKVRAFTLDDSIPIHEVTIALEEARMAVELAMQVRTRLVEGYREIMNMQL